MATMMEYRIVILFGGGDAGGIIITPHGIKRIPPWNPLITATLKGLQHLMHADVSIDDREISNEISGVAARLNDRIVGWVDNEVGSATSIVFLDGDDGFVCGSTGKPPIPIPRPHAM